MQLPNCIVPEGFFLMFRRKSVLVITDRLRHETYILKAVLEKHTDLNILGITSNAMEAKQLCHGRKVDFLIIAGYLEDENSYQIIRFLRAKSRRIKTVHWALLDSYIASHDSLYRICFTFDQAHSLTEFLLYLKNIEKGTDRSRFMQV